MSASIDDLLARVQRQEDREAILETWHDYLYGLDSRRWDALGDVFTDDAVLESLGLEYRNPGRDGTYEGRERILRDFYGSQKVRTESADGLFRTGHFGTNLRIKLEGDEATTLSYYLEIVNNTEVIAGSYQQRMRREPDRWRIAFLRISVMFRGHVDGTDFGGCALQDILALPV